MKRAGVGLVAAVVGLSVLVPSVGSPSLASPPEERALAAEQQPELAAAEVEIPRPAQGRTALRLLGEQVDAAAAVNGVETAELREILRTDESAWLSTNGLLHYKEPIVTDRRPTVAAAASYPLEETFELHSKPGAQRTIFIDVDGADVSGTEWHTQYPATPTVHPAWDPAGDGPTFSATELATVQAIWAGVAEDYAPFDVDVTTEDPGAAAIRRSGALDQEYGAHALITPSGAWDSICEEVCGGVAFINVFDKDYGPGGNGYGSTQPAWIFPQGAGDDAKGIVEALSHEVGHQLGLQHDGNPSTQTEHDNGYDEGHGAWAPIMGAGYYRPITQWSKGDYAGANNQQDDIAIIRSVLGERADEAPSTVAGAPAVPTGPAYISSRTDVDTFRLGTCSGPVSISAAPTLEAGANLDLELRMLNEVGTTVGAAVNPASAMVNAEKASGLGATVSANLPAGVYHVAVDGVGNGPWSTGYDDYGSLGAYDIEVTGACADSGTPGAPGGLTATGTTTSSVSLSWSAPADPGSSAVTGYVLTRTGSDQVVELGAGATAYTWAGLAPATSYSFTVRAVNATGSGAAATLEAATAAPAATVAGAPQDVTATWSASTGELAMYWQPPTSDGGSPVTGYVLSIDGTDVETVPADWRGVAITNVSPGTYLLGVAAVNAVGTGPRAQASVSVTPIASATSLAVGAVGQQVTLVATVSAVGGTAGSVRFEDGASIVGVVTLGSGAATLRLAGVAPGQHAYRATYVPSNGHAGSTSAVRTVTISAPIVASRTTIKAPRAAKAGSRPTVTVRVVRGSAPASGTVVLKHGAKKKTLTLRQGKASFKLPRVKAGKVRLTATYAGNATTKASSASATLKVAKKKR